jgi:RNA polymerase sigma-70 factor (ECF subfamily)
MSGSADMSSADREHRGRTNKIADEATLDRARRGDTDALADLWAIYQPQLLALLRRRGRATAEDIASQVWIDVERRIDGFEGDGDAFRAWICTIGGRRAIDESRRSERRRRLAEATASEFVRSLSAAEAFDRSLDGSIALLDTLQPAAAEVVLLRVVHDLPVAEVAQLTGQTESNVRVLMHRALDQLRQTVGDSTAIIAGPPPALSSI